LKEIKQRVKRASKERNVFSPAYRAYAGIFLNAIRLVVLALHAPTPGAARILSMIDAPTQNVAEQSIAANRNETQKIYAGSDLTSRPRAALNA
jgi:hypothetical protein